MVALAPPPTVRVGVCVPGLAASSQVEVLEGRGLSLAAAAAGGALWLWVCVAAAASFFLWLNPINPAREETQQVGFTAKILVQGWSVSLPE